MPTNLRDIYKYFSGHTGGQANDTPWNDPRLQSAGPVDWADGAHSAFARTTGDNGMPQWSIRDDGFLGNLNKQYAGAATMQNQGGQSGAQLGWDMAKLPKTRFGTVDQTAAVDDRTGVIDPRFVYDDPVYGKITHRGNVKSEQEWVGPALMAALSMGAGSLAGLGAAGAAGGSTFKTAMGAAQALRGLGSGNKLGALGALGGMVGIPT